MFAKLVEQLTGLDDLERVANRGDMAELRAYLETRPVLIPQKPSRFLDADNFSQEELLALVEAEASDLAADDFRPWVFEENGQRRLPAFSSEKKMHAFVGKVSKKLHKVFGLGAGKVLIFDVATDLQVDFVDLNLYSEKSWEIGLRT
ncbi:hypothetical protein [Botrimarina sp.]|uniref:hypothetical protein n=1 Tax=Botrimarina sp. TaxID=2795802 RepID=UPI0032ECC6B7